MENGEESEASEGDEGGEGNEESKGVEENEEDEEDEEDEEEGEADPTFVRVGHGLQDRGPAAAQGVRSHPRAIPEAVQAEAGGREAPGGGDTL